VIIEQKNISFRYVLGIGDVKKQLATSILRKAQDISMLFGFLQ